MKPNIDISDNNRQAVADLLNILLADEYTLFTKTRNAHWNIVGSNFIALHKFFEGHYEALDEIIDSIAERVRSLGHYSLGTLKDFLKVTHLSEGEALSNEKDALKALLQDHESVIANIRKDILTINDKYKDVGSADFITGIMEAHEKMAWMLRSHLS
jgi:starvation-inducible DNA-binding protein